MVFVDKVKKKRERKKWTFREQNSSYSMNLQLRLLAIWLGNDGVWSSVCLAALGTHVMMGGMSGNICKD